MLLEDSESIKALAEIRHDIYSCSSLIENRTMIGRKIILTTTVVFLLAMTSVVKAQSELLNKDMTKFQ